IGKLCFSLDSRFITIDKIVRTKDGAHGVGTIYRSEQGRFQKKFDKDKSALLNSDEAVGEVRLYPYPVTKKRSPGSSSGPSGKSTGEGRRKIRTIKDPSSARGSIKRARRSGFLPGTG